MSLLLDALKKAAEDKQKAEAKHSANPELPADNKLPVEDDALEIVEPDSAEEIVLDEELIQADLSQQQDRPEELELDLPDEFDEALNESEVSLAENSVGVVDENRSASDAAVSPEPVSHAQAEVPEAKPAVPRLEAVSESGKPKKELRLDDTQIFRVASAGYDHDDARKILQVSQKNYKNKQHAVYYGMFVFAGLLFFAASYLYYIMQTLDNDQAQALQSLQRAKQSALVSRKPAVLTSEEAATAEAVTGQAANVEQAAERNTAASTVAPAKKVAKPAKQITISKQKKADPISVLLAQAYVHYQAAEYSKADAIYQQILQRDARQRDALLGRAAIAVRNSQLSDARTWYQYLLQLDPKDSIAKSALVDLTNKELSVADETKLNLLLRDNPEAAHVHFSLGLLYAKQKRLSESQQAFFNAFSLDKKADYAFNLAVSLDRLGKINAALLYYKQASELADQSIIHFDEKVVLKRIETLEAVK